LPKETSTEANNKIETLDAFCDVDKTFPCQQGSMYPEVSDRTHAAINEPESLLATTDAPHSESSE